MVRLDRRLAELIHGRQPQASSGLIGLVGRDWVRMDEAARPWSTDSPLAPIADRRALLAPATDVLAAIAGSMHRDGRRRQPAVENLAAIPGPLTAAAPAVHNRDWVAQLESAAWQSVSHRSDPQDTTVIVSVLLVRGQRRRCMTTSLSGRALGCIPPSRTR